MKPLINGILAIFVLLLALNAFAQGDVAPPTDPETMREQIETPPAAPAAGNLLFDANGSPSIVLIAVLGIIALLIIILLILLILKFLKAPKATPTPREPIAAPQRREVFSQQPPTISSTQQSTSNYYTSFPQPSASTGTKSVPSLSKLDSGTSAPMQSFKPQVQQTQKEEIAPQKQRQQVVPAKEEPEEIAPLKQQFSFEQQPENEDFVKSELAKLKSEASGIIQKPLSATIPLSEEEKGQVAQLVQLLGEEKLNYGPQQVEKVIMEKGYSQQVAREVVKQLYK